MNQGSLEDKPQPLPPDAAHTPGAERVIGVVGPCASGKSTLVAELKSRGYSAHQIAQEHSYVPDMWRRLAKPDLLIYLDVSFAGTLQRKKLDWTEREYERTLERLQHARQHADLYIATDNLSPDQVLARSLAFLDQQ